jgi:hypothetical protein
MRIFTLIFFASLLSLGCLETYGQKACSIKKYISPDGSLYYFVPYDTIYYTRENRLMAAIITDKENYFLSLVPYPKPADLGKKKDYQDLKLTLSNATEISVKFFDTRFPNDSTWAVTYLLDKKMIDTLKNNQIESLYFKTPFQDKQFHLKFHRDLVREHLACLKTLESAQ